MDGKGSALESPLVDEHSPNGAYGGAYGSAYTSQETGTQGVPELMC